MAVRAMRKHNPKRVHEIREAAIHLETARDVRDDLGAFRQMQIDIVEVEPRAFAGFGRRTEIRINAFVNDLDHGLKEIGELIELPFRGSDADITQFEIDEMMRVTRANRDFVGHLRNFVRPPERIAVLGAVIPLEISHNRHVRIQIFAIQSRAPAGVRNDHVGFDVLLLRHPFHGACDRLTFDDCFRRRTQRSARLDPLRRLFGRLLIQCKRHSPKVCLDRVLFRQEEHFVLGVHCEVRRNVQVLRGERRMQNKNIHGNLSLKNN